MSNFDLKLDRWEKIATIGIGILGVIATAYTTIFVIYPGHKRDTAKACFEHQQAIKKSFKDNSNTDADSFKETLKLICKVGDGQAGKFMNTAQSEAQAFEDSDLRSDQNKGHVSWSSNTPDRGPASIPEEQEIKRGFVSLGKVESPQSSNFINFKTDKMALKNKRNLVLGTVLKARGSVNLRDNKSNTEAGKNPILSIIYDEECVKMEENLPEPLRKSYWVEVSLSKCE